MDDIAMTMRSSGEASREARELMAYNDKSDRLMRRFGRNLSAARIMAKYDSAEDFAKVLGIKGQAYRKYERGESMPPPDLLEEMKIRLDVNLDWLLLNIGEPKTPYKSVAIDPDTK